MPYKERKLNSQTFVEYHLVAGKLKDSGKYNVNQEFYIKQNLASMKGTKKLLSTYRNPGRHFP